MEEYCSQSNDNQIHKCDPNGMNACDISADDDQTDRCDAQYGRQEDIMLSSTIVENEFTSHLASSGLAGVAAAMAISSSRSRNKSFAFETIPAVRKRQATRLLRKIQNIIEEYNVRVGQQAVLLVCNPRVAHKPGNQLESPNGSTLFKVYGSQPLEHVVRNLKPIIIQELDSSLRNFQVMHEQSSGNANIWSNRGHDTLPPLMVDGIPTPLEKMTQAQLRAFIPVMLKYSTNRGKPGWGRPHSRPPWWPDEVPWANVRSDVRTPEEKAQVSWTAALKKVVRNCYEYHGREDLLADYSQPDNSNVGIMRGTQMMDIDATTNAQSYLMSSRGVTGDVNENSHGNVYTLGVMHMPTSEGIQTQTHYSQFCPPTYSIKSEKDGTISIVRVDESFKAPEVASMEAAATLEDYNTDGVKFGSGEEINMQQYGNGGEMVSLPAESMMHLDSDSTAALYQIISSQRKIGRLQGSATESNPHM